MFETNVCKMLCGYQKKCRFQLENFLPSFMMVRFMIAVGFSFWMSESKPRIKQLFDDVDYLSPNIQNNKR